MSDATSKVRQMRAQQAAYGATRGVLSALADALCIVFLLIAALSLLVNYTPLHRWVAPTDDSDASPTKRSGMKIYKDALTGCEWVKMPGTPAVERTWPDGRQICRKGSRP